MPEVIKEKTSDFATLVAEKEKQGLKTGQRLADFLESMGQLQSNGDYQYEQDAVIMLYDRLLGTVVVKHGHSDVFRVNLITKACPLYKEGTWRIVLAKALRKLEETESTLVKMKNELRIREAMGLPKH